MPHPCCCSSSLRVGAAGPHIIGRSGARRLALVAAVPGVHGTQHRPMHPVPRTCCLRLVAASSAMDVGVLSSALDPAVKELASQIIEAEEEIKGLFEPGKVPPRAAVVAKKRNALSEMKELLASKLNGQGVGVDPDASDEQAERARQLFLEVEKSLQRQSRSENAGGDDSFELSLLEEENERLRDEAEALLTRQFQLEDLAEKHGLITFHEGTLVWNKQGGSSPSATAATPATGSSAGVGGR
ncbi:hypothetical protein FOA52_007642 [Chlamydomonas sp. UWO 241]|nr:hypothetical protein FOA52_007642 [Chlamydomonas sp. UWO 241]